MFIINVTMFFVRLLTILPYGYHFPSLNMLIYARVKGEGESILLNSDKKKLVSPSKNYRLIKKHIFLVCQKQNFYKSFIKPVKKINVRLN